MSGAAKVTMKSGPLSVRNLIAQRTGLRQRPATTRHFMLSTAKDGFNFGGFMCKQFICEKCAEIIYSSGERVGECEHYKDEVKVDRLFDFYPKHLSVEKARVEHE